MDEQAPAPALPDIIQPPYPPSVGFGTGKRQTRVILITKLYHQIPNSDPTGPQIAPYTELLETEEQPYQRTLTVQEAWTPIDFGWTGETGCSFLSIVNAYNPRRRVTPTVDQREEDLQHVLEIGKEVSPGYIEIICVLYVGQPLTISPVGQDQFRIRCRHGEGRYTVYCVPNDPI